MWDVSESSGALLIQSYDGEEKGEMSDLVVCAW